MPTRTAPKKEKSLTATENRKREAEQVLASFASAFLGDAEDLKLRNTLEAMDLIKRCSEITFEGRPVRELGEDKDVFLARFREWKSKQPAEPLRDAIFKAQHETFQSQLMAWLNSLGEFTRKHLRDLAHIAANYRQSDCEVGQEAHWARVKVEQLLKRHLGQRISPEPVESRPTQVSRKTLPAKKLFSVAETRSRWVCEGFPDLNISDSGFAEPWEAPAWYDDPLSACLGYELWIKAGRPERLSPEQTGRVSRSIERLFARRLHHNLDEAEHRARLELAIPDRVLENSKSQPPSSTSLSSETPSSDDARVALGEWAERRLQEAHQFTRLIRAGRASETLRPDFPKLFSDVIDRLPALTSKRLLEEACGRMMKVPDLMDFIGNVKQLSAHTLNDYRKKYRSQAGIGRKRPKTNIVLPGSRPNKPSSLK
jgi:hypothetical protein